MTIDRASPALRGSGSSVRHSVAEARDLVVHRGRRRDVGAMLFAYGYLRVANPDWNEAVRVWPTIANGIVIDRGAADQQS